MDLLFGAYLVESCELLEEFIENVKEIHSKINNSEERIENFIDYLYG